MTEQEKRLRIRADIDGLIRKMRRDLRVFFEKQKDEIVRRVEQGENVLDVMRSMKPQEDSNLMAYILLPYITLADKRGYKIVTGKEKQTLDGTEKFITKNDGINQTTFDAIESKINNNPDTEKSKVVSDYYKESAAGRTKTIAVTTVNGAYNQGQVTGAEYLSQQSPNAIRNIFKKWVTQHDFRVRDTHAEADGQTVRHDDDFDVGGEALEYPGDPTGSIENTINCRCYLITVVK